MYYGNFTLVKQGLLISGQATAVKVSPTTITFPNTAVGTTSAAINGNLPECGLRWLAISSVTFSGQNDFSVSTNNCGSSVPANSSCTFNLMFKPTAVGTFSATMKIGDIDPTGPRWLP